MAAEGVREIRKRIRSTQKTAQITKTMQMVAASRLKKSQAILREATPYAQKMEMLLSHLLGTGETPEHPFFQTRDIKTIGLVVITSDRGLCGAYNARVIAKAEAFLLAHATQTVKLIMIGRKGTDHFKTRSWPILLECPDVAGKPDYDKIVQVTQRLIQVYLAGEVDALYLAYSHYHSALSMTPSLVKVLGLTQEEPGQTARPVQTILEPDRKTVWDTFLPRYMMSKLYLLFISAATAENSARMIAMKMATDNAKEMVEALTLRRNKARQAAITKEILEIVTAGEALKG